MDNLVRNCVSTSGKHFLTGYFPRYLSSKLIKIGQEFVEKSYILGSFFLSTKKSKGGMSAISFTLISGYSQWLGTRGRMSREWDGMQTFEKSHFPDDNFSTEIRRFLRV